MALKSLPTFHDSRYLYTGLLAFANIASEVPVKELECYIRQGIQEYVAEQQRKYLLAERTSSYQKIPSYIVSELTTYGLLEKDGVNGGVVRLTSEGRYLLDLLLKSQGLQARTRLAALYIETFSKARYFLERLWEFGDEPGLRLPEVNYSALEPLKRYGSHQLETVIKKVGSELFEELEGHYRIRFSLDQFSDSLFHNLRHHDWQKETKQKSFQTMRRAVDNFMLSLFFPNSDISRPKFDVLRDRSDSFGLVNYRKIEGKLLTWEHIYLTAWVVPPMRWPQNIPSDDLLTAKVGSAILYTHEPKWESIRKEFISALRNSWENRRLSVGYARIIDLREDVCFILRIGSGRFDDFIKRITSEDYPKIAFSASPERYTSKALPLYLGQGRTYNLVRLEFNKPK